MILNKNNNINGVFLELLVAAKKNICVQWAPKLIFNTIPDLCIFTPQQIFLIAFISPSQDLCF